MLTIRRFQMGDETILSPMIRRTLREVNYTSPKSELDYLIPHYSPETMVELARTGHTYVLEEDGQIIGSGTVLPDGETEAEIVAAFLAPESIGQTDLAHLLGHGPGLLRAHGLGEPQRLPGPGRGGEPPVYGKAEMKKPAGNCPGGFPLWVYQNSPVMRPSSSTSMFSAAGTSVMGRIAHC